MRARGRRGLSGPPRPGSLSHPATGMAARCRLDGPFSRPVHSVVRTGQRPSWLANRRIVGRLGAIAPRITRSREIGGSRGHLDGVDFTGQSPRPALHSSSRSLSQARTRLLGIAPANHSGYGRSPAVRGKGVIPLTKQAAPPSTRRRLTAAFGAAAILMAAHAGRGRRPPARRIPLAGRRSTPASTTRTTRSRSASTATPRRASARPGIRS